MEPEKQVCELRSIAKRGYSCIDVFPSASKKLPRNKRLAIKQAMYLSIDIHTGETYLLIK